jgi:shikimate kinase
MKTVYLYGFMGCGKSHTGRRAARTSGAFFADLDEFIKEREGMEIAEIFSRHGEKYFRELEFSALSDIEADVISLGGGALTNSEAADFAKKNAVVIFIDTAFEVCYERIANDKSRPKAAGKTKDELFELYQSRLGHYREVADFTLEGEEACLFITRELKQCQEPEQELL